MPRHAKPLDIVEVYQPDPARVLEVLVQVLKQAVAARNDEALSVQELEARSRGSDAPPQSDRAPTD
jgi:hypothetical protein